MQMEKAWTIDDRPEEVAQPQRRLKVLLSAYACEPHKPSEPGVGWQRAIGISEYHDVWVLTSEEHREPIEAEMAANPNPHVHFVFVKPPAWQIFWHRNGRGRRLHYYLWQIAAYRMAKALLPEIKFDLAHHVTYVSYWTPSFLSFLPIPLIWGPVGGGDSAPRTFYKTLSPYSRMTELMRDLIRGLAEFDPFLRATARRSHVGLATTPNTILRMQKLGAKDVRPGYDAGLPDALIDALLQLPLRHDGRLVRFISIGRLIGWKGYHLSIMAFAQLVEQYSECDCEYVIVGTGPEHARLQALINALKLGDKVRMTGLIPHDQAMRALADSDVLVHPSMHDSGGWTGLEAQAAGRPVICLDLGGSSMLMSDETSIKVPALTPEQAISDMADAMQHLARNPDLRRRMGEAGRRRIVDEFRWDEINRRMAEFYRDVVKVANADQR